MKRTNLLKSIIASAIVLATSSIFAQVGINTTTPAAGSMLDVTSTDKGILIPRVDILDLSTIAPITGGSTQSLLVYNIGSATQAGFYYWNVATTEWVSLSPAEDADFYEVGTTTAPTAITQDVFRTGNVAIGKTTANYALEVRNDTDQRVAQIISNGTAAGSNYGLFITQGNDGVGTHYGMRINVSYTGTTGTDRHYGTYNQVNGTATGTNQNIGTYNTVVVGAGEHTGTYNSLAGTEDSGNTGTLNLISNSGDGDHTGMANTLTGAGSGEHVGVLNNINGSTGDNWGFRNDIDYTASSKTSYGTYNKLHGNDGGTAIAGYFTATGTGTNYAGIFENGNVGIGTIAPTEELHVIGNILASGTITPDYVFENYYNGSSNLNPNYKMLSLEEIEHYTKTNNHLPGVPSALEVKEQGGILINRATEINLEKIEELFLHTIEASKKIALLEKENKALQGKLNNTLDVLSKLNEKLENIENKL